MSWGFVLLPDTYLFNSQIGVNVSTNLVKVALITIPGHMKKEYTKFDPIIFKVFKGNKESLTVDATLDNFPFDLSNYTITCIAKKSEKAVTKLIDLEIIDLVNGNNFSLGKVVLVLEKDITKTLPSKCLFEIKAVNILDPDDVVTISSGEIHTHEQINDN